MAIASLVLGIISLLVACIPICGFIILIPALIGLILGIVSIIVSKKKNEAMGMGIAGTILNAVALLTLAIYLLFFSIGGDNIIQSIGDNMGKSIDSELQEYYNALDSVEAYQDSVKSYQDSIASEIEKELAGEENE